MREQRELRHGGYRQCALASQLAPGAQRRPGAIAMHLGGESLSTVHRVNELGEATLILGVAAERAAPGEQILYQRDQQVNGRIARGRQPSATTRELCFEELGRDAGEQHRRALRMAIADAIEQRDAEVEERAEASHLGSQRGGRCRELRQAIGLVPAKAEHPRQRCIAQLERAGRSRQADRTSVGQRPVGAQQQPFAGPERLAPEPLVVPVSEQ
ncbi:MAG: hypothetical protein E6J91_08305 [Deltaproteobacteria bacterium]|nr:MAG: hypothetical protein E6J91_08305 [Deltaproteobacteria bacterium]